MHFLFVINVYYQLEHAVKVFKGLYVWSLRKSGLRFQPLPYMEMKLPCKETDQNFGRGYLRGYTWKLAKTFTVSFCQQDLSKSVKITMSCIFGQTHDNVL